MTKCRFCHNEFSIFHRRINNASRHANSKELLSHIKVSRIFQEIQEICRITQVNLIWRRKLISGLMQRKLFMLKVFLINSLLSFIKTVNKFSRNSCKFLRKKPTKIQANKISGIDPFVISEVKFKACGAKDLKQYVMLLLILICWNATL